jgi:thioredoxin-disulfide reductase
MYDCIIIGSGPAGMTAGIYSARREMKTLIIGEIIGGQVTWASDIGNYPGFININAFDLILKMKEHVESLGVEIKGLEVKRIEKGADDVFIVYTEKEIFKAKSVIISIGLKPRRLEIPGEVEFRGKGVTYCASCDAPFYRGKNVAVVGGGNSALDAAEILSKIAKQVYLIHRRDQFKGFEALEQEVKSRENIELVLNSQIKNIIGKEKVEKIAVENSVDGQKKEIEVDGVFIEIGRMAHTDLVADFVSRTEQGQIIVDEKCRTQTPGMFAAGDTTNVPFKQITIAMGQATIAALSAYEYLQLKQGNEINVIFDRGKH